MSDHLFALAQSQATPAATQPTPTKRPAPRMQRANRDQILLQPSHLESLLAPDHRARVVWEFVKGLDLSAFEERILAREGHGGRAPFDPAVVLTLWIYATLEAVGSARLLERLCGERDAYRWICGGPTINHHTLSDFRSERAGEIDELMAQIVGLLVKKKLVTMERVAQDGVKVRASAGAPSFRRKESLERCVEQAREQVAALREEIGADPQACERRKSAAKARAAEDREQRVTEALAQWKDVAAKKKGDEGEKLSKARVSTTDPDARVMKMADGGFRPAFNGQFATDTRSQVIVGVALSNAGNDMGQMTPMLEQLAQRYGSLPGQYLVDGGFAEREAIADASARGCAVYAPPAEHAKSTRDPYTPREGDAAAVAAWRVRMGTAEAKKIYRQRAATAECVNAIARNRGLKQFLVRGIPKCLGVLTLFALATRAPPRSGRRSRERSRAKRQPRRMTSPATGGTKDY